MTDKDKPNPSEKPIPTPPQPAHDGGMSINEGIKDIPPATDSDEE